MTSRQFPRVLGLTQASRVIPVVKSSEAASLIRTDALEPLNARALPKRPAELQVAPLSEPLLALPEVSLTAGPVPSSKPYAATRPAGALVPGSTGREASTTTVAAADETVLPAS